MFQFIFQQVFGIICPQETNKEIIQFSWNVLNLSRTNPICSIQNKNLRISYNKWLPFFSSENNQINIDTIEGNAIKTFIEKHNLITEWKYENLTWGNRDENGTFNGVIGRVM